MKRIISGLLITTCLLGLVGCGNTTEDSIAPIEPNEQEEIISATPEIRKLTLEDVIEISKKGENIDWADFEEFEYKDIGSGLFVYKYDINDEYHLLMGGAQSSKPLYVYLVHKTKKQIDIRYENIEEFLAAEKSEKLKYETAVSYANWTSKIEALSGATNFDLLGDSANLPVFHIKTIEKLNLFKEQKSEFFSLEHGYDEIPSFEEVVKKYDEKFFENNELLIVYKTSSSGSYRYKVVDVVETSNSLTVYVGQANSPEIGTDDMAGWFLYVETPKLSEQIAINAM